MTPKETVQVCAIVQALCPAQRFDEATAAVWHPVLERITFADAQTAIIRVAKRARYIAPCDIHEEAQEIRRRRALDVPIRDVNVDPDDRDHETRERMALTLVISDGYMTRADYAAYLKAGVSITPPAADLPPAPNPVHVCIPDTVGRCWCAGQAPNVAVEGVRGRGEPRTAEMRPSPQGAPERP